MGTRVRKCMDREEGKNWWERMRKLGQERMGEWWMRKLKRKREKEGEGESRCMNVECDECMLKLKAKALNRR